MSILAKDMLSIGEAALREAGCADARIDAELLCRFLFKLDATGLFLFRSKDLDQETAEQYFALIDRRAAGEPLQYITGTQAFMGLEFKVDSRVLIPRQDTETLVETALKYISEEEAQGGNRRKARKGSWAVLDLCCGSGAAGLSLIRCAGEKGKTVKAVLSDISPEALEVARENGKALGVFRQASFEESDLFAAFRKKMGKKTFDLIISNPPYIRREEIGGLQKEIRDYEPVLALDGGPDGLAFYRRIVAEAPEFLKKNGVLILEIGADQCRSLTEIAETCGGYDPIRIFRDLGGNDRVAVLQAAK